MPSKKQKTNHEIIPLTKECHCGLCKQHESKKVQQNKIKKFNYKDNGIIFEVITDNTKFVKVTLTPTGTNFKLFQQTKLIKLFDNDKKQILTKVPISVVCKCNFLAGDKFELMTGIKLGISKIKTKLFKKIDKIHHQYIKEVHKIFGQA